MRRRRVMSILVAGGLLLSACGDDGESANGGAATTSPADTSDPQGRLLVEDDFDNDDAGWVDSVFEDYTDLTAVEAGELRFTSSTERIILPTAAPTIPAQEDVTADQRVETTVTIDNPGVAVVECRRSWDPDDPSRVQFRVSTSGAAGIERVPKDAYNGAGEVDRDTFIELDRLDFGTLDIGDSSTHELALECTGGDDGGPMTVAGFLDGDEIVTGTTEDPPATGYATLGMDFSGAAADDADITDVPPFTVAYDRFMFYDLAQDPDFSPMGPTVVDEEFRDDSFDWLGGVADDLADAISVEDGALEFDMPAGGSSAFATPFNVEISDVLGDQRIETTATLSDAAAVQVVCRASGEDGDSSDVRLSVTADGGATLQRVPPDGVDDDGLLIKDRLVELATVEDGTLDVESGTPVDIALECTGGTDGGELTITGFVDGDEVISGVDPDPTPMGYGAIAVESAAGASGDTDLESAPAYTVSVDRYTLIDLG